MYSLCQVCLYMNNIGEVGTNQLNVSASFLTDYTAVMLVLELTSRRFAVSSGPQLLLLTEAIDLLSSKRFSRGAAPGAEMFLQRTSTVICLCSYVAIYLSLS